MAASALARGLSLLGAFTLMLLVTLAPRALTTPEGGAVSHGLLMLVMWGLSAGFVHGVGFVPRHPVVRLLLGPIPAWLGMGLGFSFYLRYFMG
ncbi:cyd operon YbgE family protein [Thiobacter aerophilum]|uniref:Cyd operon YbgE family protein n=1 Tax=Thiobacter aerophilum TaxID=3121275 RepID=A0ABV0EEJ5_9BURK